MNSELVQSKYYEIQLRINPEIEDIVTDICFEIFDCEGVVLAEETYKDLELVSTTEGTLRIFVRHNEVLTQREVDEIFSEQKKTLLNRGLTEEELGSWVCTLFEKDTEDWSKKWKEKWDVTYVTERITVVPEWIEYTTKRPEEVIIRLEPGCAFGTGTHETTQLCMKAIEKYMPQDAEVADIGTGSGILGVCAIKFGAKSVYGCDVDETVIPVAIENSQKNGVNVPEQAVFELNTADKISKKFDFVTANILHNVLAEIMRDLKRILKPNGILSLSGILDEKKPVVLEAIRAHNLTVIEEIHQNQWTSFVVRIDEGE